MAPSSAFEVQRRIGLWGGCVPTKIRRVAREASIKIKIAKRPVADGVSGRSMRFGEAAGGRHSPRVYAGTAHALRYLVGGKLFVGGGRSEKSNPQHFDADAQAPGCRRAGSEKGRAARCSYRAGSVLL